MDSIFGVPLAELKLEHIERFLATADTEPLLWEAKGTERPRPDSIRKHVCGFANRLGGYLIIGAKQTGDQWKVNGVDFGGDEPNRWISDCIGTLRSPPFYDVSPALEADHGLVLVVEVEPVQVPPCMTASGTVFQRVSGATVAVTEPLVLHELTTRGREMEARACRHVVAHAEVLAKNPPSRPLPSSYPGPDAHPPTFGLAMTALGPPPDVAERVYRPSFFDEFQATARRRFRTQAFLDDAVQPFHSQGAAWVSVDGFDFNRVAFAHRDGTIAVSFGGPPDDGSELTLTAPGAGRIENGVRPNEGPISQAWRFANDQLYELGCRGEARLCLWLNDKLPRFKAAPSMTGILRDVMIRPPATDELSDDAQQEFAALAREVRRALGYIEPEPEVEP